MPIYPSLFYIKESGFAPHPLDVQVIGFFPSSLGETFFFVFDHAGATSAAVGAIFYPYVTDFVVTDL